VIKISVLYPHKDGAAFDMDYYLNRHIPMVRETLGTTCKGIAVEQGLSGAAPGSRPTYVAMGHILFDSVEAFHAAFAQHGAKFMADVPHYTTIEPVIQVSEVKLA
jgi:uncharacterized protein (TIGR02118 family)